MRERRTSRPSGIVAFAALLATAGATVALAYANSGRQHARPAVEKYTLAHVRRMDLHPSLTASGRVESSKRTVIECELENISIGVLGERLSAGGASVLLSIIPEGSVVHRGDVLAVLDASNYEELLRQQRMTVERSRADHHQAELNMEIAKLAVREFRDGSMAEAIKDFKGSLALAESELSRIKDRLEWARRMKSKGYVAANQVTNEEFNFARAVFSLGQERGAYELYTRWMAPRNLKVLEGRVLSALATFNYQQLRLNRNLDRLAKLENQVRLCTIRAPHDGFVIYANDLMRDIRIEPGMYVRQKQDLLYLPNLSEMEVVTSLHESVLREVSKGMAARVYVEGMANRRLEGHVTEVAQVPTFNWRSDVRFFDSVVKLDDVPRGILPGMSAQVQIQLDRKDDVLTVPAEAVAHEDGRKFCYVALDGGLERREIKLGDGTMDYLEVSEGLREGEQVVLNPVPSEVQEDVAEETPLITESRFAEDEEEVVERPAETVSHVAALN
ncbi:MAG: efflux RND transporter periplasmic adaptor subunit [Isosphaeraceae bacterium]